MFTFTLGAEATPLCRHWDCKNDITLNVPHREPSLPVYHRLS